MPSRDLRFLGRPLSQVESVDGAERWDDEAGEVSVFESAMPWAGDWMAQYKGVGEGFGDSPEAALAALEADLRERHEDLGRLLQEGEQVNDPDRLRRAMS